MKYCWLTPKDQKKNSWILHRETKSGVVIRSQYTKLQCEKCSKLDELTAIYQGIEADVAINSSSEFLTTDDGFVCVSQNLRNTLESHDISNVEYLPISATCNYFVMLPTTAAPMLNEHVGMEFHRPCSACGRFRETCFLPSVESFVTNTDPLVVNFPDVKIENVRGRQFWYCITRDLAAVLKQTTRKGLEFTEAY